MASSAEQAGCGTRCERARWRAATPPPRRGSSSTPRARSAGSKRVATRRGRRVRTRFFQSARRSAFRRDRRSHRASSPSSPLFASRAHGGSRRAWRPRPFPRSARLGSARLPKPPAVVFSAPPRQPWCPTCVPSPGTRKTHRRSPVVEGGVFRGFRQRASRARRVRDACQSRKRRRARGERSRETPRASVMSAFSDPTRGGMLERRGRSSSRLARGIAVREESSAPYRERVVLLRHRLHVGHHLFAHLVSVRHRLRGRGRE